VQQKIAGHLYRGVWSTFVLRLPEDRNMSVEMDRMNQEVSVSDGAMPVQSHRSGILSRYLGENSRIRAELLLVIGIFDSLIGILRHSGNAIVRSVRQSGDLTVKEHVGRAIRSVFDVAFQVLLLPCALYEPRWGIEYHERVLERERTTAPPPSASPPRSRADQLIAEIRADHVRLRANSDDIVNNIEQYIEQRMEQYRQRIEQLIEQRIEQRIEQYRTTVFE